MSELTRSGDGTAQFTPPASLSPDLYNLASQGPVMASRRAVEPFSSKDFSMWPIKGEPGAWGAAWTIRDIAGLNLQRGEIAQAYNRAAKSTADTSYFGQATLPLKLTEQQLAIVGSNPGSYNLQGANVFGRQFIGLINTLVGPALLAETSATDPTLVQIATAGGIGDVLFGIYEVEARDTTVKAFLALCKAGQPIQLLNDSAGTVFGTMNAATATAGGIVTTPFGNVIKAQNSYWFLPNTSAYNAAPTEYNAGAIPGGGWAMGLKGIGNRPIRCYFNVPAGGPSNVAQPGLSSSLGALEGTLYKGHVESTNIYGYDRQIFDMPGLKDVNQSCFFRDGIIGTDLDNITHMGRGERHIVPFAERNSDSDVIRKIVNFYPRGQELYWGVEEYAAPEAHPATRFWLERYDWDTDMVTQVSPVVSHAGTTGLQAYRALGAGPVSAQTGYFHGRVGPNTFGGAPYSWRYWRPEAGVSVYGARTSGGSTGQAGHPYQHVLESDPIEIELPEALFPAPITWARKVVTGYHYGGELQYGQGVTAGCSNAPSTTWRTGALELIKNQSRWHPVNDSKAGFLLPQPFIRFWTGGSDYSSQQVFPLTIYFKCYEDTHAQGWRDGA